MSDREATRRRFVELYAGGAPPWEIGRPRPFVIELVREGWLAGDVVDLGCGTGENALYLAQHGCRVLGIDLVPAAIEAARQKARERGIALELVVGDVLEIDLGDRRFDAALDVGLFHVFDDEDRERYVRRLAALLRPGGRLALSCFSDRQPGEQGPRRVSEAELRAAFSRGWEIVRLERHREESRRESGAVETWRMRARRRSD